MQQSTPVPHHDANPRLQSERLALRPIRVEDAEGLRSYRGREDVVQYLLHDALTPQAALARVSSAHELWQRYPAKLFNANFAVELKDPASAPGIIGDVRVWNLLHDGSGPATEDPRIFWIGYAFHPDMQGKGYAREAAARLLQWVFEEHGATEVRAIVWAPNTSSSGLLLKLGFQVFRELDAEQEEHPKKLPAQHLRLFRDEWLAANAASAAASAPNNSEES